MEHPYCHKHKVGPKNEEWQVAFQELVAGEDEHIEPFTMQVCPQCFLSLREKNRKNRRALKTESKRSIRLGQEVSRLQKSLEAVGTVVFDITGKDAFEMVGEVFPQPCNQGGRPGGIINMDELGQLERILPNLIMEAIQKARSEGHKQGEIDSTPVS
jgi:hypothetical protein